MNEGAVDLGEENAAVTAPLATARILAHRQAWGRTLAQAGINGLTGDSSVWTGKDGQVLLPIPKKLKRLWGAGDVVEIELDYGV